ncbi:MAG: T9SS type A sorting domain-containing protein [bacterium]|nr:T9SS type A sorting domain-containing protein [bacterium]
MDLSAVLSLLPADTSYVVRFRVVTDFTGSDVDSTYLSNCGAFVVDDVSLSGGGENYSTGFETSVDGWHGGLADSEYWLVENRQPVGFDTYLHNSGLVIMHADDRILHSRTGNSEASAVRGLVVEEADGIGHLLQNPLTTGNTGDAGDPWPGSTNNTAFNSSSTPNSNSNSGQSTEISISGISASGAVMDVMLTGGDPAPRCDAVAPDALDNDQTSVLLTATGTNFRAGATFRLEKSGEADIMPLAIFWHDPSRLDGEFNLYSVAEGLWDVVCTNPDGQETKLPAAVQLVEKVPTLLVSADVHVRKYGVEIDFELFSDVAIELPRVSRANKEAGSWVLLDALPEEIRPAVYNFVDRDVVAGRKYYYRVSVKTVEGAVFELYRTSATIPSRETVLEQNYPNPFNPNTTISYYVPETTKVRLDIYTVSGAHIRTLVSGVASEGSHEHVWDGRDNAGNVVSTGVYLFRLRAGSKVLTRKMLVVK